MTTKTEMGKDCEQMGARGQVGSSAQEERQLSLVRRGTLLSTTSDLGR